MNLAAPPVDANEPPGADRLTADRPTTDRVVGGVAAYLADRLDLDALWIRIAFVLLALAGGIGVLVYAGLWLFLIAGPTRHRRFVGLIGGALIVFGVPLALNAGSFEFVTGPVAVILLLGGLALALWQPRRIGGTPPVAAPRQVAVGGAPHIRASDDWDPPPRPPRPRREPSPLGRATLGVAIVAAAAGALIDQANGGRLHPEQWLGAAAIVCGAGLLVGVFRGRARWLVVPAAAFAVSGAVAGEMAKLGIPASELGGQRSVYVYQGMTVSPEPVEVGVGEIDIQVDGAPTEPVVVEAAVAIGDVEVVSVADVAVEVRRDGDDPIRVGPDRAPDVVVEARVGRGDVHVTQYARPEDPRPTVDTKSAEAPQIAETGTIAPVVEGVGVTSDGWFVLADGAAIVDATDQMAVGDWFVDDQGITVIVTDLGEFRLLPRSLLVTPTGEVVDLLAVRAGLDARGAGPDAATEPTTPPIPTTPPTPGG